jgi:hypothetical protein
MSGGLRSKTARGQENPNRPDERPVRRREGSRTDSIQRQSALADPMPGLGGFGSRDEVARVSRSRAGGTREERTSRELGPERSVLQGTRRPVVWFDVPLSLLRT